MSAADPEAAGPEAAGPGAAGPELTVVRGGGDLATGIVWRLTRARWPVVVTELAEPLSVRRTVSVSSAVGCGSFTVEGMRAEQAATPAEALDLARRGTVAVLVCDGLPDFCALPGGPASERCVVVDARMAKRNIDTSMTDAALVVGVGPGFTAGRDCHAVIETKRGHRLGRCLWSGAAAANTSVPGAVEDKAAERVLRAPADGTVAWTVDIADAVTAGQPLGSVGASEVTAPFDGVVRGLIAAGLAVQAGAKIGDVDPRGDASQCSEISDKSLAVGGGVVEAVLTWTALR